MSRFAAAAVVFILSTSVAGAVCGSFGPDFGQIAPSCGGSYCYIVPPPSGQPQTLAGSFWSFGSGTPAIGAGVDNGAWSSSDWLRPIGSQFYFSGSWQASTGVDGCITGHVAPGKPAEIMMAVISEETPTGAFFAAVAVRRVSNNSPEFDFTFAAGGGQPRDVQMVEMPRARVGQSNQNSITFVAPTLSQVIDGLYGDGSLTSAEMITGYRVYKKLGSVTSRRSSAGWTAMTGVVPLGQEVTLPLITGSEPHYAYALVFDRDFETAHVGADIHVVSHCHPTDLDGDGISDFNGDPECCPFPEVCDCNDANAEIHPGAPELCNGIDDDCDEAIDNPPVPAAVSGMSFSKLGAAIELNWAAAFGATRYDVVSGDLTSLRSTSGDFSAATRSCPANDVAAGPIAVSENPASGEGFWYLLRGENCVEVGSYDNLDFSQWGSRDLEIASSSHSCP